MTLRTWVEAHVGTVGTRQQLEAFETGLLEAWARAAERGDSHVSVTATANLPPEVWTLAYRFKRELSRAWGIER